MPDTKVLAQPRYMEKLLQELGWSQGTRIPLANPENQNLEEQLIHKQNEIQRLQEALSLQKQKQTDLAKYQTTVSTECQENIRLLLAHKNQMEQEVKLRQLSNNEADRLERDTADCQKRIKSLSGHIDRFAGNISKLLKRADTLKTEVCGERGALQEWRAAIERSASDIDAIEMFTKQDTSKAKALDIKRQKLKVEHDRMHERLTTLMSNLAATERACERTSVQVKEGMEMRKQLMQMWSDAVENLRQRDKDIRLIREDYALLEVTANKVADECREQQTFADQQKANNDEVTKELNIANKRLGQIRMSYVKLQENNVTLDSEIKSLQRELANMQHMMEKLRMENKDIVEQQQRKDALLEKINNKIKELKVQLEESLDKTKSAEMRAKQLEKMLNVEEQFASNLTRNQTRAIHCTYNEQQKLLKLKNEQKLFHMRHKASKAILSKLESKQIDMEKRLQTQKESLYTICYQVETIGARLLYMEGEHTERECIAELVDKENRLKNVCARHAARVALLERHSHRLHDDMRRLEKDIEIKNNIHASLTSRLRSSVLIVEGGTKDLNTMRGIWRRERVEEALLRLRVAHQSRTVAGFEDTAYSLDNQRLHLEAAMSERLVEIAARRDIFSVQKRSLMEDCGKLRSDIRERQQRITQLIKRFDIFIASLGKDDSGQNLSVSFFKIKFAAERAELRERGAALDADIKRRERDMSALEATMRVVAAAHTHFLSHIQPLSDDSPEIEEVAVLTKEYYRVRDEFKCVREEIVTAEQKNADLSAKLTMLSDKCKQLSARELEAESELENARERLARQETRLQNARDVVKHNTKRAKKLIEGVDEWRIFQMALWVRDYAEAAHNALHALHQVCAEPAERRARFAELLSASGVENHMSRHQRRLLTFVQRIVADSNASLRDVSPEIEDTVFSPSSQSVHSGLSQASGFTKRLATFRKSLATRVQEPILSLELPEIARRSTVSLRVVTLGLEEQYPQ